MIADCRQWMHWLSDQEPKYIRLTDFTGMLVVINRTLYVADLLFSILNKLGICPIRKPKSAWAMLPQFLQNPLGIFNNLLSQIITKSCTNITVFSCLIAFLLMVYNTENYCYPTWKLRKRKLDFSFLAFLIILLVSDTLAVVEYMYIIKQSFHSISLYKNSKPTWVHIQNW